MNVNSVNMHHPVRKNAKAHPARRGALITTGMLTASTAISWATRTNEMRQVVKECGGRNKYIANYALGLALFAGAGAIVNTVLTAVANKITPKKPPKAAN